MDYFRFNIYNKLNNISVIILFLGDYITSIDKNIEDLYYYLDTNYDELKGLITKNEFELNQQNKLNIYFVNDNIYNDDSIYDIKQKIIINLKNNILLEELYLFGESNFYFDSNELFQDLSNNNNIIDADIFDNYVVNFKIKSNNEISYNYDSFMDIGFKKNVITQFKSIGIKLENNIPVNPFLKKKISVKRSVIENSKLLYEYNLNKKIINIVILRDISDVNEDIIKNYYPMLTVYGIENNEDLQMQFDSIKKNNYNTIDENTINKFHNIKLFYDYSNVQNIQNIRLQLINFFIRSKTNKRLPIEKIFKNFNSTEKIPLIKFNPGKKKEYIFRLFSNQKTKYNNKIPYVNKSILRRYLVESRGKSNTYLTFFININEFIICNINLYDNGDMEILFESKSKLYSYNDVEKFIKKYINEVLINIEKMNFLNNIVSFEKFDNFKNHNILINDIIYYIDYPFDGNFSNLSSKITQYQNNIGYIFKILHNSTNSVNIAFEFEKISIYDKKKPQIIITYNNTKNLSVYIEHVEKMLYIDTISNYLTGIINLASNNKNLENSKLHNLKDIDEEQNKKKNYLDKFIDVSEIIDDNENKKEINNDEADDEINEFDEGDDEDNNTVLIDDEDDNDSLGLSVNSEKSIFAETYDMNNQEVQQNNIDEEIDVDYEDDEKDEKDNDEEDGDDQSLGLGYESDGSLFGGNPGKEYRDYHQQRIKGMDPKLFEQNKILEKNEKYNYKPFTRFCQTQQQRQPIIITKEEKEYIDKNHNGSYGKHFLKYSSNPNNPYYYICPRYWCPDKNISLTNEQVYKNEKGQNISEYCKEYDGSYGTIIQADLRHQHRDDKDNYIYNRPGFGKSCIPCCFKQDGNKKLKNLDENDPKNAKKIKKIKQEIEDKEKKLLNVEEKCLVSIDNNIDDIVNTIDNDETEDEYMNSRVNDDESEGNNESQDDNEKEFERDDNEYENITTSNEFESKDIKQVNKLQFNYIKQSDKIPLGENQLGDISNSVKQFLKINNNFYRFGVENDRLQSFIGCISMLYTFESNQNEKNMSKIIKKIKPIKKFKKEIIKMLDIDQYSNCNNGDLNIMFYNKNVIVDNKTIDKYKTSKYFTNDKNKKVYFERLVNSYENFLNLLKNDNLTINHIHLWDVTTNIIFKNNYNLIIVEYDIINDNIYLICPNNKYSNDLERFDKSKSSFILLKNNEFYEPLFFYSKNNLSYLSSYKFSNNSQLNKFYNSVFHLYRNLSFCGVLPSNYENSKYSYMYNTSNFIYNLLLQHSILVLKQVINYQFQNIGFIVSYNETPIYLPNYPSKILDSLEFIYINDTELNTYIQSYSITLNIFEEIFKKTNNEIPCKIIKKVLHKDKIIGLYTLSNDFIKIIPEKNKLNDKLQEHEVLMTQKDDSYIDPLDVNNKINNIQINNNLQNTEIEKLFMNNNLYDKFKKYILLNLTLISNKPILIEIQNIVNSYTNSYDEKVSQLLPIIKNIGKDIKFIDNKKKTYEYDYFNQEKVLPKFHLLNNSSNEIGFYNKLTDQFIRYTQFNNFYKLPKQYISNEIVDYNLNNNEILTFQSFINSENLNYEFSEAKLYNDNFNLSYPEKSKMYSNEVILDKLLENVVESKDTYYSIIS